MTKTDSPKHVFVITFGRTGSTLLQGLLNGLFGARCYGENSGFLMELFGAYSALQSAHAKIQLPENDNFRNAWYGASRFSAETILPIFRTFSDEILFKNGVGSEALDSNIVGFKEIRHIFIDRDLNEYLRFLRLLYGDGKFIFLVRDVEQVVKSGWWARNDPSFTREQIGDFCKIAEQFVSTDDNSILLDYDDIAYRNDGISQLSEFLSIPVEFARLDKIRDMNFSYDNRNLSVLLRGGQSDILLIDDDWWLSNVDEFTCAASQAENGDTTIEFGLLMRTQLNDKFHLENLDSSFPIELIEEHPEFSAKFVEHPCLAHSRGQIVISNENKGGSMKLLFGAKEIAELRFGDAK